MKVLIISHCQISTDYSIGKTLASLFSKFEKKELCQLYVHSGVPNLDKCNSYYRVTDKDIIKGLFKFRVQGQETFPSRGESKRSGGKGNPPDKFKELLRDALWTTSKWFGKDLISWLRREAPTCIFVAVGSGKFLYNIALKISKSLNIPIITYVCDDFYFNETDKSLIGRIWLRQLRKKSNELFSSSKAIVSISPEMSAIYQNTFSVPTYTVMTGSEFTAEQAGQEKGEIRNIKYFGKLSLNRYKSILEVCKAIDEINSTENKDYALDIFCGNITDEIMKAFKEVKCVRFHDFVSGEEFKREFLSSDALLHVEAFDIKTKERVKYSVSTKIADSLASGIPLFAYGPKNVSSIEHLIRNNCAVVATKQSDLKYKLTELFSDEKTVRRILSNAADTAKAYHSIEKVGDALREIVKSVNEDKSEQVV